MMLLYLSARQAQSHVRRSAALGTLALAALLTALSWQSHLHAETGKTPQSFTAISPIFGQLVAFSQPSNFVVAYEKANASQYIREAVPKGESTDRWTQMITVTGAKELAESRDATTIMVASVIANGFKKHCPKTFTATSFGHMSIGGFRAFAVVASCGSVEPGGPETAGHKHGETALILAIKGESDFYTLQWAERSAPTDKAPVIDAQFWKQRLAQLQPIRLCAIIQGEAPPYPSCTSR
jgi:hypothetical protein